MKRFLFAFALVVLLTGYKDPLAAQDTRLDAAPLVVMNLAAHPDDEDGRTLTYYRRAKNAIAYSVIYTRGEGGQNEIGPELYEELGAIRSAETERAARILGTQTYFLNFKDFGYSKKASEAFDKWGGRDEVTSRVVYLVRKLKPDVLFTNHDTLTVGERLQHGQHQAVGISTYDAFTLAADPSYHPEQLEEEGVDLWQPKRLFLRRWFGAQDGDHDVVVSMGDVDKMAGKTYSEIAIDALGEHASQGMGMFAGFRRMSENTYFSLLNAATDAPLDSTDLAGNLKPNKTAQPDLNYWIDSRRLPGAPDGSLMVDDEVVVPGQTFNLTVNPATYEQSIRVVLTGPVDTSFVVERERKITLQVAPDAALTMPKPIHQYNRFVNHPPITYAIHGEASDALLAGGYLSVEVAPPLVITTTQDVMRLQAGQNELPTILTYFDPAVEKATLNLAISDTQTRAVIFQKPYEISFGDMSSEMKVLTFELPESFSDGNYTISLTGLGAPVTAEAKPAHVFVTGRKFSVDVAEGIRVGVIESYDNTLSLALSELGVDYVKLDSMALAQGDFKDLHTVLVDIRAYLVRADLRAYNDDLLSWVADGGHMVVNYQKTFEWNETMNDPFNRDLKNPSDLAPYPLQLSRDRVTREDAPVTVLHPELPLFNTPNAIDASLWENWVQERGLYYPGDYDKAYLELFEMNDPGEAPLRSSTLMADYGKGTYVYTALGWYRQLKVYHPGVYAFFANLISLPLVD